MNKNLQHILDVIQQNDTLSQAEKNSVLNSIQYVNKELEITVFKLERTEAVKRTTAILLEETIEELEQKRKAVEAQNRELEIEGALEKVRTIAIGMKEPMHMLDVCKTISAQLHSLGVSDIRNVQTAIFYEQRGTYMKYEYYARHDHTLVTETTYANHAIQNEFAMKMLKGKGESFVTHIKGDEVRDWIAYQRTTNVFIDTYLETASSLNYYWFSLGPVALGLSTYHPLREEDIDLFKRFVNVFELAYRRYLDIERAEAQAREAQIEAALEKVRSRSLAMHRSDELQEVVNTVFERLKDLNISLNSASIFIFKEGSKDWEQWVATSTTNYSHFFHIPYTDLPIFRDLEDAKQQGKDFYEVLYPFLEKNTWFKYAFEHTEYSRIPDDRKTFMIESECLIISFALGKTTALQVAKYSGILFSDYDNDIVKRFAKVFEQAYIRFLDLQKAEAQAREGEIQLALERVRARTMAMQTSSELSETAFLMANQIRELGIKAWGCAFHIYADNEGGDYEWFSNEKGYLPFYKTPREDFFKRFYDKRQSGETLCLEEFQGKACAAHYKYLMSLPVVGEALKELETSGLPLPTSQIDHVAYFSYGYLLFITFEPAPAAHDIFKRFSREFEQTYTRFLDLQKAEAQAREAQIELTLERVRARTMAMQKSEELREVIQIVSKQFVHLNILVEHAGFIMDYKERDDMHIWLADQHEVPFQITIPYFDSPHWNSFNEAKQKGAAFFANQLNFEEKNKFYQDLFKLFSVPDEAKEYYFSCPGLAISTVLLENVGLYIENFSGIPYADEENTTLMRFGKVFQQTYTRFNDLKRAEAQAREAQIEAAIERVRSKAMAMYNTNDLSTTVSTFFKELRSLNVLPWRCGVGQLEEETKTTFLTTTSNTMNGESFEVRGTLQQEGHPVLDGIFQHWQLQKEFYPVLQGEDIRRYYEIIRPHIAYPEHPLEEIQYGHFIFIKEGFVYAWTESTLSEGELEIFRRFASVLSLTYRRYLDLKESEEQNRIIQADNARKTRELEEARQLQLSMLPKTLPTLPHLDIAVYMKTSSEVGGDYYDFTVDDDGTLTAAIGDATGHGMKAGTIVSMIKTLFVSSGARMDMKTFFTQSSDTLKGLELGRLMMAFIMLKIRVDKIEFANAGMPPLFIYREGSKVVEEIMIHGMPLGAMKRFPYDIRELDISSGDTILLLSDGLPELRNRNNEQYGYERVKQEFMISADKSPGEIVEYLKNSALEWSNGTEPDDDVTFVVIKEKMN